MSLGPELEVKARDLAGNITSTRIFVSGAGRNSGFSHLLAQNNIPSKTVFSESVSSFVELTLNNPAAERATYLDHALIDGMIRSNEHMVKLFINGKEMVPGTPRKVYHFSCLIPLEKGENYIDVMALTPSHHSDSLALNINKKIPVAKMTESRLKIVLDDFEFAEDNKMQMSRGFENRLASAIRKHKPCRFSSIDHLRTDRTIYRETARKEAKKNGFDCILFGYIEERENSSKKTSIRITAWLEDTEDGNVLVEDTDVYGEDADKDNISEVLDALSGYMNMKLTDELPVVEGNILERKEKNITVDFGKKENVKKGMKLIVYELEEPGSDSRSDEELGEAIIKKVSQERSYAYLNKVKNNQAIKPKQNVITR